MLYTLVTFVPLPSVAMANALFPASWRRLDAFHSDLCGSAGSGVITEWYADGMVFFPLDHVVCS